MLYASSLALLVGAALYRKLTFCPFRFRDRNLCNCISSAFAVEIIKFDVDVHKSKPLGAFVD